MNIARVVTPLFALVALSSCVTKPTPGGHPGVAMLYSEPPSSMFKGPCICVGVKKVDAQKPSYSDSYGVKLTPGTHQVEFTMSSPADDPMIYGGGLIGALVVEIGRAKESPREQTLGVKVSDGADYIARHAFGSDSRSHVYWVEHYPDQKVVAGTRPADAAPVHSPFAEAKPAQ